MKKAITITITLLVAATLTQAQAPADVQAFVDKVKAVNPVGDFFESGVISYQEHEMCDENGESSDCTFVGASTFNRGSVLVRRQRISGNPKIIHPPNGEGLGVGKSYAMRYYPDGTFDVYLEDTSEVLYFPSGVLKRDSFRFVPHAVFPESFFAKLPASGGVLSDGKLSLGPGSAKVELETDAGSRVTRVVYTLENAVSDTQLSDFVSVAGKWLPTHVIVDVKAHARSKKTEYQFDFKPQPVSDAQLQLAVPNFVHSRDIGDELYRASQYHPSPEFWWNHMCAKYPEMETHWEGSCCYNGCGGYNELYMHHHICAETEYGPDDCNDIAFGCWAYMMRFNACDLTTDSSPPNCYFQYIEPYVFYCFPQSNIAYYYRWQCVPPCCQTGGCQTQCWP